MDDDQNEVEIEIRRKLNKDKLGDKRKKSENKHEDKSKKSFLQTLGSGKIGRAVRIGMTAGALSMPWLGKAASQKQTKDTSETAKKEQMVDLKQAPPPFAMPESKNLPVTTADYSNIGQPAAEQDQVRGVGEQIEAGKQLERQRQTEGAGKGAVTAAEEKKEEAGGEEKGSVKGLWNKLQKMKEEERKDEMQKVTSQQAFQVLQKQAQELVRQGWSAVHETVEDLALSFIDLTILTGPLCGLVLFIRILGFAIWPPISVKGVEVSLFPWFSLPGDFARVKSLLALIISFIFWTIIIAIIYAFNNPLSTLAKIIGL